MDTQTISPIPLDKSQEFQRNVFCQKSQTISPITLDRSVTITTGKTTMGNYEARLDITRGTYKQFIFQLETADDITQHRDILMTIKEYPNDDDSAIVLSKTFDSSASDLTTGKIVFTFLPEDTRALEMKTFWYDIQLELKVNEIYQVSIGNFVINRNIYHRMNGVSD